MRAPWTFALVLLAATVAAGDEPIQVESLALEDLLDLDVAAATKVPVPLSASPAVGAVVKRDQIDDFGWLSLNDVLYTQPGFFPSMDYERRTVGARGEREDWNNNRILLLIDGMPQNDVETGTAFTWETTPLFLAQRVELLRGAGSALYGSYALNGVVSLDTPTVADLGAEHARARFTLGDDGTQRFDVLGGQASRFADLVLAYDYFRTPGDQRLDYDASGRTDPSGALERFKPGDKRASSCFFLKADGKGPLAGFTLTLQEQTWSFGTYRGWLYFIPDHDEDMTESRQMVALRYRTPPAGAWRQEVALQLQRHGYDEQARLYPAGAPALYPGGVNEHVITALYDVFARAQVTRLLPDEASILAGAEYTALFYDGDDLHDASVDLNDPSGAPPPVADVVELPPLYEPIQGHVVSKVAVFGQLVSGQLLGDSLELTLGLRFDDLFFHYTELTPGRPERSRSYEDLSPRAAVVWRPAHDLSLKLMVARAFRTPTPVELFASNSWTTAPADPQTLRGERQDTVELAADWRILPGLRLRANGFAARLDDEISYAVTGTEIVNRFSDTRVGLESELVYDVTLPGALQLDGWLSYSLVKLVDETVYDPGLAPESDVWRAPSQLVKAGLRLRRGRFAVALQAMGQGEERRAATDVATEAYRALRPDVVPAWLLVDASARVQATDWVRLGVTVRNLFDSAGRMAAPADVPFDDHVPERRVLFQLDLGL